MKLNNPVVFNIRDGLFVGEKWGTLTSLKISPPKVNNESFTKVAFQSKLPIDKFNLTLNY